MSITLRGRLPVPLHGLGIVLRHAPALGVHGAEVVLGAGVTLLCGLAEPLRPFNKVLWHALANVVHDAEEELGVPIAPLSKRTRLTQRSRVVVTLVCLITLQEVLPPCRGGKHQEHQYGEDAFHVCISRSKRL